MSADVVDTKTGKVVPISRIMLHHILFLNLGDGSGPSGIGRTFAQKLDRPGTYKLFCSLHPVQMTQVIKVK